jgi:hypothetical protein
MPEDKFILKGNNSEEIPDVEMKRIREAIKRTDTEKFFLFCKINED